MTVSSPPRHFIGEQEYLDGELHGELRHEYIDGQVYAMTGASDRHGLILNALAYSMTPAARRKGCQLFTSDMKLRLEIGGKTCFYYPDLLLSCDPQDREPYFRRSPCLIVEVLSPSTERIDRREKLFAYQTIPSLREYLLIDPDKRCIEIYRFGNPVRHEIHTEGSFRLDCLDAELTVDEIYMDVEAL